MSDLKAGKVPGAPYLKGELIRDVHGDHVFRGMWSLEYKAFDSASCIKSEFELKHRSTDPDDCEVSHHIILGGKVGMLSVSGVLSNSSYFLRIFHILQPSHTHSCFLLVVLTLVGIN